MYGLSIYKWMIWGDLGGLWGTTPFRKPPYIAMYHRYCWHPVEHPHSRFVMSGVSWKACWSLLTLEREVRNRNKDAGIQWGFTGI